MKYPAIDTLARTIYGEARSEPVEGMEAIACVVLNRLAVSKRYAKGYWWGNNIEDICRKPFQFSCWNVNDPNLEKIQKITLDNPRFMTCFEIAKKAVEKNLPDVTGGATHYFNPAVVNPKWAFGEKPTAKIGRHIFYRPKEVPKS